MAKTFRCRPSEIYGITGAYRQYLFDNAVASFGRALEAALDEVTGKNQKAVNNKRARILDKWLERPLKYRSVSAPGPTAGEGKKAEGDVEVSVSMTGVKGA